MILYRGISLRMWDEILETQSIKPKGNVFLHCIPYNGATRFDGNNTYGPSTNNAAYLHQIDSDLYKTSGISMSPLKFRALNYAFKGLTRVEGVLLELDTDFLPKDKYVLYDIASLFPYPNVPEDKEMILVNIENKDIPLKYFKVFRVNIIDKELNIVEYVEMTF